MTKDSPHSIEGFAKLPLPVVGSLELACGDRIFFAHFQSLNRRPVFSGRLVSVSHFRTSTAFFSGLEPIEVLQTVESCDLLTKCSVCRFPNLWKQANLFDSRALTKVACENPEVDRGFRSPTVNRQVSDLVLSPL
jgi:hypothetical protein